MVGTVTGITEWQANLTRMQASIERQARDAVGAALGDQLDTTNPLTPVRTGYLKSRNQTRITENGPYRYVGEYFNDAPYAIYVFLGTRRMRARDAVTPGFVYAKRQFLARCGSISP